MSPHASAELRQAAAVHERGVGSLLRSHGWTVNVWGSALLAGRTRDALRATDSPLRWAHDLLAVRGHRVALVDAKATASREVLRVERAAHRAHERLILDGDREPICEAWYVFGDTTAVDYAASLRVLGLHEMTLHGLWRPGSTDNGGSGTPQVVASAHLARTFDEVFA